MSRGGHWTYRDKNKIAFWSYLAPLFIFCAISFVLVIASVVEIVI